MAGSTKNSLVNWGIFEMVGGWGKMKLDNIDSQNQKLLLNKKLKIMSRLDVKNDQDFNLNMHASFQAVVYILLASVLFVCSTQLLANDVHESGETESKNRKITFKGKIDPRLTASIYTIYRPTKFGNQKECLTKHVRWTTGRRRGLLKYSGSRIVPDENHDYEITVPFDFIGDNHCEYRYRTTRLYVSRDKKDNQVPYLTVMSDSSRATHSHGDMSVKDAIKYSKTSRKYFQASSGTQIVCFTTFYALNETLLFQCIPEFKDSINGVDEIISTEINIDIVIDEDRCLISIPLKNSKRGATREKDYFRDYHEKKSSDSLMKMLGDLFNWGNKR